MVCILLYEVMSLCLNFFFHMHQNVFTSMRVLPFEGCVSHVVTDEMITLLSCLSLISPPSMVHAVRQFEAVNVLIVLSTLCTLVQLLAGLLSQLLFFCLFFLLLLSLPSLKCTPVVIICLCTKVYCHCIPLFID